MLFYYTDSNSLITFYIILVVISTIISVVFSILKKRKKEYAERTIYSSASLPPATAERKSSSRPFLEDRNFFFERKSSHISKDDIKTLLDNANYRIKNQKDYPYADDTTICISSFKFDREKAVVRLEFKLETKYRTIERYYQRNYVKYPVYSEWKTKHRFVNKSLRINADTLEEMTPYSGEELGLFRENIIVLLNSAEFVPSWAIREWLDEEARQYKEWLSETSREKLNDHTYAQKAFDREYPALEKTRTRFARKKEKLERKKQTYGRIKKLSKINKSLAEVVKKEDLLKTDLTNAENEDKKAHDYEKAKKAEIDNLLPNLKKSAPRLLSSENKDEFIPLSKYYMIPSRKIVGVYIIRNNKNSRVYVGQSKDVMRRIKQHFHGTVPANAIFAEDYYSAPEEERKTLFSVKIQELGEKSDLDEAERNLIEEYEAYTKGYNGTKGNS